MKIKVMKITYHAQIGYSVFYRTWYWPFWRQFLYGINEGGGQYFIFEDDTVFNVRANEGLVVKIVVK